MAKRADGFLDQIIDYAGTFPPASLTPEEAVSNYFEFMDNDEGWIVENLAWRVVDLKTLADLLGNRAVGVAAIGRPSADWPEWQAAREADAKDMSVFLGVSAEAQIQTYECAAPPLSHFSAGIASLKSYRDETDVYFELPWDRDVSDELAMMAEGEWLSAKFRCGGNAIPSPTQLATVLKECIDLELPFKLTAGLHEPIAHDGQHGFLNVFAAIGMRYLEDSSINEMARILADDNPLSFSITGAFAYRGREFSEEDLEDLRSFFITFGSCSVDEPLAGLNRLIEN